MSTRVLFRLTIGFGLMLVAALSLPGPAQGDEIVATIDPHGHKVYVNTGDPVRKGARSSSFRPLRSSLPTAPSPEIEKLVKQTAGRHQVDPQLIHAIIQVESDYQANAVSRRGAIGLMQLIPATAQRFGVADPFNATQNIEGGVTYLRYLLNLYRGDVSLSLAAYNAGEHAVERYGGIPQFTETENYVRRVTNLYNDGESQPGAAKPKAKAPYKLPIYRFVDAKGVVHFTNGDGL